MNLTSRWLALSAVLLVWPGAARAEGTTLEKTIEGLVKDIKAKLKGKEQKLTLGTVGPDRKADVALHSSAGTAILHELKGQLTKAGIKVDRRSDFTLSATFIEVEVDHRQQVQIDLKLYDRNSGKDSELSARVTNEVSVAHLLGISVQYPPNGSAKKRQEAFQKEVDKFLTDARRRELGKPDLGKPKPTIEGTLVRPAKGSKFAIEIRVAPPDPKKDGKRIAADYKPLRKPPKDDGGLAFVELKQNELYAIRLVNTHDFDIAVSLTIDGLSTFIACDKEGEDPDAKIKKKIAFRDPKTGKPRFNHFIVPKPRAGKPGSVLIRGWFINLKQSDEFKVTTYAKSLAAELQAPAATPGVITAAFHAAVPKDQKFPPGEPGDDGHSFDASATGRGARFNITYQLVERKIGGLRGQVSVRYDRPKK